MLASRSANPKGTPTMRWLGPLAPAMLIMGLFFAGPIIWSVYIAFTNKALTGVGAAHPKWVAFANFTHMFQDPLFIHSLVLTAIFVIGSAIIRAKTLRVLLALLLRGEKRFLTR